MPCRTLYTITIACSGLKLWPTDLPRSLPVEVASSELDATLHSTGP